MAPVGRWFFLFAAGRRRHHHTGTRRLGGCCPGTKHSRSGGHYTITCAFGGPVTEADMSKYQSHHLGADIAEAIAVHEAVKLGLTTQHNVTIHYDSTASGKAAESRAKAFDNIAVITSATNGLIEIAQMRGHTIDLSNVKSHEGAPMNELVDDMAKHVANNQYDTGKPYHLAHH